MREVKNTDLKSRYDAVYRGDSKQFYSFSAFPESQLIVDMIPTWNGLDVLEIGCGEGQLAAMLSFAGARRVDAVDYSAEAIKIAEERVHLAGVTFICSDYKAVQGQYDAVVMQGVLEHLDAPFEELERIIARNLKPDGTLITSSPSFLNPRGYVWMALQLLFDVPMSLTDLHFLCPFDFQAFAAERGYELETRSANQDWGAGERTIVDFHKRLRNALNDAGMDNSNVDRFLAWLQKAVKFHRTDEYSGATVVYKLSRNA